MWFFKRKELDKELDSENQLNPSFSKNNPQNQNNFQNTNFNSTSKNLFFETESVKNTSLNNKNNINNTFENNNFNSNNFASNYDELKFNDVPEKNNLPSFNENNTNNQFNNFNNNNNNNENKLPNTFNNNLNNSDNLNQNNFFQNQNDSLKFNLDNNNSNNIKNYNTNNNFSNYSDSNNFNNNSNIPNLPQNNLNNASSVKDNISTQPGANKLNNSSLEEENTFVKHYSFLDFVIAIILGGLFYLSFELLTPFMKVYFPFGVNEFVTYFKIFNLIISAFLLTLVMRFFMMRFYFRGFLEKSLFFVITIISPLILHIFIPKSLTKGIDFSMLLVFSISFIISFLLYFFKDEGLEYIVKTKLHSSGDTSVTGLAKVKLIKKKFYSFLMTFGLITCVFLFVFFLPKSDYVSNSMKLFTLRSSFINEQMGKVVSNDLPNEVLVSNLYTLDEYLDIAISSEENYADYTTNQKRDFIQKKINSYENQYLIGVRNDRTILESNEVMNDLINSIFSSGITGIVAIFILSLIKLIELCLFYVLCRIFSLFIMIK